MIINALQLNKKLPQLPKTPEAVNVSSTERIVKREVNKIKENAEEIRKLGELVRKETKKS